MFCVSLKSFLNICTPIDKPTGKYAIKSKKAK